jgi:O-antigen biosynthesis protein
MNAFLNRVVLIFAALLLLPFALLLVLLIPAVNFFYLFRRIPGDTGLRKNGHKAKSRIMIIQSAEPVHVLKALDYLDGMPDYSNSHRTVFCRNRSEILNRLGAHPRLHTILPHSETQGWWEHFDRFRRQHFDAVVVLFTGDPSYWKVKYFALLLGARRKLVFNENNQCLTPSWKALFVLMERDLLRAGLFQSIHWRMNPRLRRLAEIYELVRARALSSGHHRIARKTLALAGFAAEEQGTATPAEGIQENTSANPEKGLGSARQLVAGLSQIALSSFLSSQARFRVPGDAEPEISVVLVLFNRAELTFQCLRSLAENARVSMEIIIVDNNSSDETSVLLDRLEGARIVRNSKNIHFLKAANAGAGAARGEYVLFLNNDAQVLPGSLLSAIQTLKSSLDIGAVGGKLILPNGVLQEAGSIVWQDGSCLGYGRGDDPFSPRYMFRRDVDYCSGAFLLTRRKTFTELGGFDEAFLPFYYEETDFCLRLWENGLRVVYEPEAAIIHYEFASSSSNEEAQEWHAKHQGIFLERHRDRLRRHYPPEEKNILPARDSRKGMRRVLFIDDQVPHPSLGSGFPRSNTILSSLVKSGFFVTLYPTAIINEEWRDVYVDVPREVEVMLGHGPDRLKEFLGNRAGYYDFILISRPHNMQFVKPVLQANPDWFRKTGIIYDAEAIFTFRDIAYQRLQGKEFTARNIEQLIKSEVELAAGADLVLSVSKSEAEEFVRHGVSKVHVLGHALAVAPTSRPFEDRSGFLFVGSILEETSPNGDAVLWFIKEVLPIIQSRLGSVTFTVAGNNRIDLNGLAGTSLRIAGRIPDLFPFYDEARVFVAPTRFAAGIPHKIHEAASRGLPVVATSLLKNQLSWTESKHLLVGDDPQSFAEQCIRLHTDGLLWNQIRRDALDQIRIECSVDSFETTLRLILENGSRLAK